MMSPTRLEGMETIVTHEPDAVNTPSLRPALRGWKQPFEDSCDIIRKSPTRLEGMETCDNHLHRHIPLSSLRPALRGWKPFQV